MGYLSLLSPSLPAPSLHPPLPPLATFSQQGWSVSPLLPEAWPQGTAVPTTLAHTLANSPFVKPSSNYPNWSGPPGTFLNPAICVDPDGQNMVPALEKLQGGAGIGSFYGKCQDACLPRLPLAWESQKGFLRRCLEAGGLVRVSQVTV